LRTKANVSIIFSRHLHSGTTWTLTGISGPFRVIITLDVAQDHLPANYSSRRLVKTQVPFPSQEIPCRRCDPSISIQNFGRATVRRHHHKFFDSDSSQLVLHVMTTANEENNQGSVVGDQSPQRDGGTHFCDISQEHGNNSFTKGFDHRENELLLASPSPVKKKKYHNVYGNLNSSSSSGQNMNHDPNANNGNPNIGAPPLSTGIELQFLPPDQRLGLPGDLLASLVEPEIEDDTEAAEALRANASIKVGKVGKVARSVNAQTVRKLVKKATLRGHGNKRGKPPRIPPGLATAGQQQQFMDEQNQIYALQEGDDESDYVDHEESESEHSDASSVHDYHLSEKHSAHISAVALEASAPAISVAKTDESGRAHITDETGQDDDSDISPVKEQIAKRGKCVHPSTTEQYATVADDNSDDVPEEVVAATMDTGRKLMGALDPHNMLQFQRWRRKKKGEKKKRKSYVKGKVIDGRHELYTLSIAVMLGVRTSIARTNTVISASDGPGKKMLSPQDFMSEEKYEFAPKVIT
jgi:hypothetical protein